MSSVPPFPSAPPARVLRLDPEDTAAPLVDALRRGAVLARPDATAIELVGPGAVACFQGLLTNDIEGPGDGSFGYGALLTPKGMIVVDGWAVRSGATVRFTVPAEGHEPALALLARSVPPRLARTLDRSRDVLVLRLVGPRAAAAIEAIGLPLPNGPGRIAATGDVEVARPPDVAPFAFQVTAPGPLVAELEERLGRGGAHRASAAVLELARILAGWPRLGAEIDARTIPQEVRYDEIGGVSYTKGCYTGQETVSRLHFRGHTNRELRGLEFDATPAAHDPMAVVHEEREVGRVTSVAGLPEGRWIGLGVLRREVTPGSVVRAGDVDARVVTLPFQIARPQPA